MAVAVRDPRGAAYREAQAHALRTLLRRHPWVSQDERLDIYNEVWARLLERERDEGFWPDNLEAYLVGAVEKRARHEARARATHRTDPADPLHESFATGGGTPMDDQVHGELDADGLRAVIARLTLRQQAIAKLRFDWQLSPREISSVMDLPVNRFQLKLKNAKRARISRRFYKLFRTPRYELAGGTKPKIWLTAVGGYYTRKCRTRWADSVEDKWCKDASGVRRDAVLLGKRSQARTLRFLLRRLRDSFPAIGRLYYYKLHNTRHAGVFYGGPNYVRGSCPADQTKVCPREDWGLIGSDTDNDRTNIAPKGTGDYSGPNDRRTAFCVLRDLVVKPGQPRRCPR